MRSEQEDKGAKRQGRDAGGDEAAPIAARRQRDRNQDRQMRLEAEHSEQKAGQPGPAFQKEDAAMRR
jgi:hypothetical protein